MQLINFVESEDLFSWACGNFIEVGKEVLKSKPYFDVAFAGGKTAIAFFSKLCKERNESDLFSRTRFFNSDERVVMLASPESNAGNLWRGLIEPLGLNLDQFYPIFDDTCAAKEAALRYQQKLQALLSPSQKGIPAFDLLYLGLGDDGHTASLFPGNELLTHVDGKDLVLSTNEAINGYVRISFMPQLILAAKNICMMINGANKAQILDEVLYGPLNPQKLPAQLILRTKHANLSLLTAF